MISLEKRILLLEDDEILSESLIELLESENFLVDLARDGNEALDKTFVCSYDLFLFDVNVPLLDGFELLKSLRESGDKTATIFITALNDVESLAHGFDVGADDYIKKPFDFNELLIRIQVLFKKQYNSYFNEIKLNDFSFKIDKNELYLKDKFIPLPPYELKIAQLFFKELGKTITKDRIIDSLYSGKEISDGSIRVHINKLRKIGLPILTVKGIGYRIEKS
jgi:DNA-binding response OmpR family regulator